MLVEMLTRILPEKLIAFPEVSLIYMFGSQVEGRVGPLSDFDLAVLVDHFSDGEKLRAQLGHQLARSLQTERVEVILLNHAPIELGYHVIAQGVLLFQRDTLTRVEFEAQVMSRYGDYLPVLRAQREQILQGDAHGKRIQRYREAFRRTQRTLIKTA